MKKLAGKQRILADAFRVAALNGGVLTRDTYRKQGKFKESDIFAHFSGFKEVSKLINTSAAAAKAADVPQPSETREFDKDSAVIATVNKNVRTLAELLDFMEVDLNVWEVERHTINKWEVVMREPATTLYNPDGTPMVSSSETGGKATLWTRRSSQPVHEPLYQVKAWLIKKKTTIQDEAFKLIEERIANGTLAAKAPAVKPPATGKHLLEISLYDAHFGLLAWGKETGENYDLKIAEQRFSASVTDLLDKTKGCSPELIVFPIGNDFFHVNNPEGVTPANRNVLDVDGRLCKIVESGEAALINAINACLKVAPVNVLWVPGNHDPETSYFMCRIIKAFYANNKHVNVDVSPAPRKYVRYGCNIIGFTHGNEERHHDLPTIMAQEMKSVWHEATHCEWHVGHFHKQKETRYAAGDTFNGISVRVIPSICGTDAWHFRKGYVGNSRVAEAYVYDKASGLAGTFVSKNVRDIGK